MTEAPGDATEIPEALAVPVRRRSVQIVWIIPIVAALIGGWLAVMAILERGPTIRITFNTAEGLEAGKTTIKYKNVNIGTVTLIELSEDRSQVIATAELTPQAEGFLVQDTRFWVVRPRIAGSQISGLGTLLSGSYIGVDIGKSSKRKRKFTGLETPPIVTTDLPGVEFVLNGEDLGSLDIGSPVYFRRIQVGQVVAFALDKDGNGVTLRIFVQSPYDRYVTVNTRFWQASGIDLTLDAAGIKVQTESLASILLGGIAFQTPPGAALAAAAEKDALFTLFADQTTAMKRPVREIATFVIYFGESLRGLSPGAPVDFSGVVIGEVKSIDAEFDAAKKEFRFPVEIELYPERLRARDRKPRMRNKPDESKALLDRLVARGLRAQLKSGNLLTGQLFVALDTFPGAPPATVDWSKSPPVLPSTPGALEELQVMLANVAKKIEQISFEEIGADARQALDALVRTLKGMDALVQRLDQDLAPAARAALEGARKTLASTEQTLASDAPLQQDLRAALRALTRTAESLRILADTLERHPETLIRGKQEDEP
ncbi:MAG: intermembrane transport protein PqiB [Gammaproteobacteria bacterium]